MNHHRPHFSTSQGKSDLSYWLIQWHHLSFPDKEILPNPDLCWLSHSLNKGIRLWNWRLKIIKCLLVCSALIDWWCLESTFSFLRRNKNIKFNHSETKNLWTVIISHITHDIWCFYHFALLRQNWIAHTNFWLLQDWKLCKLPSWKGT